MPKLHIKPRIWHRLIQKLAATPFGIWLLADSLHIIDRPLLHLSKNRTSLTSILAGLPVIVLTTTGAKSGLQRQTPLAALADGDKVILIASYFGSKKHPGWYYNLKANPEVSVSHKGQTGQYIARLSTGEERAHYWEMAACLYPGYQIYEKRAGDRKIPVIVLEPR